MAPIKKSPAKKVAAKKAAPKWSEAADKKQDAKATKGLSPKQKASFMKIDAKMDKNKSMTKKQDIAADRKAVKMVRKMGK